MSERFIMIDEGFTCLVCGREVAPLRYTARDHCPHCLCSLHVDVFPGDRASDCKGVLRPVGTEKGKKGIRIVYECDRCHASKKNISAADDDSDAIIKLSANPLKG